MGFGTFKHYMETGEYDGAFKKHLYEAIMKADMHHRYRLWLAFPYQVNEVMEYEGHETITNGPIESIEELCGIHDWEPPDVSDFYQEDYDDYDGDDEGPRITLADDNE